MDQLINSLPALLHAAGDSEEIRETAAVVAWNHVAGEGLRRQTVPICLRQHRLIVAVADAIWKRQLASMSSQLLFRLNSLLGRDVVTFIEFQIDPGAIQSAKDRRQTEQEGPRKPEREMPIPFELVSAAAAIHDSRLRRAFLGAAMSCARRMERGEG
jgi:hypothetical protein